MRRVPLLLILGCGPAVDTPDESAEGTGQATTDASSTGSSTSPTTTPPVTSTPATTEPPTVTETLPPMTSVDSSTGEVLLACAETEYDYASFGLSEYKPHDIDTECTVVEFMSGLDSVQAALDCAAGKLAIVGGGNENPESYLEVGQMIRLVAAGDAGFWRNIAIFDDDGGLIMGSHSLREEAVAFNGFLNDIQFEPVDTDCESEGDAKCMFHRIAVDFVLGGEAMTIFDGHVGELAGYRIYPTRAYLGESGECGTGPFGSFAMYRI